MTITSNIGAFFKSLASSFKKKNITTEVLYTFDDINTIIKPMYSLSPMPVFVGKTEKDTSIIIRKKINTDRETSLYTTINDTLNIIISNQDAVLASLAEFNDETVKVTLDYYKLNILKYIEAINFFSDYARKWLNVVVWETSADFYIKNKLEIWSSPSIKADSEFVNNRDNVISFATAINILGVPYSNFLDKISSLKGHTFSEEDWTNSHPLLTDKLDVVKFNLMHISWLSYQIGLIYNGWRIKRHERNRAEYARLQLMLLALEQQKTATLDPNKHSSLEKQITYYSNLSNKLSAQIESMEGKG